MRLTIRPVFTRWRLLIAAVVLFGGIGGAWLWGRNPLARWAVQRALTAGGVGPATFRVEHVGLGTLRIAELSIGPEPWLTVDRVEVGFTASGLFERRVDTVSITGAEWTVHVRDGAIDWGYVAQPSARPEGSLLALDIPCDMIELQESAVRVVIQDVPTVIQAAGRLARGGVGELRLRLPESGDPLRFGDVIVSEAHADVVMSGPESVEVTSLGAVIGDGSVVTITPFTWDTRVSRVGTEVTLANLSLERWLPIITNGRATGEGRVSGSVEVAVDWSGVRPKLVQLEGSLRAQPQHGFIQALDAEAVGELLERQDPRFATDKTMRPVRDKVVAALQDFAFKELRVELSRDGDETVALTYLSGFGRHGEDPQGLNLTLDLHVQDAFVDLAARVAAGSKVREAARDALDHFFADGTSGREK